MEGFSSVTPVTGLNRPNTGNKDDDDDDDDDDNKHGVCHSSARHKPKSHLGDS
jgi:hypothetical protein